MSDPVQTNRQRWVRPARPEDLPTLAAAAAADAHALVAPSHVFEKDGQIVGGISLGRVVLAMPWFHTTKCKVRDTLYFINQSENLAASLMPPDSNGLLCVPFVPASPLHPYIAELGYSHAVPVTLTFKKVN